MGDLNKWHFIKVEPTADGERPAEVNAVMQEAITAYSNLEAADIQVHRFGALDVDEADAQDGFYLIKWTRKPFTLQAPTQVECCDEGPMPAGTIVAEGIYWSRIGYAPGWYEPPDDANPPQKHLFWVQHLLKGDVLLDDYRTGDRVPPSGSMISPWNQWSLFRLKKVPAYMMEILQKEKILRSKMVLQPVDEDEEEDPEEEEEEEEQAVELTLEEQIADLCR